VNDCLEDMGFVVSVASTPDANSLVSLGWDNLQARAGTNTVFQSVGWIDAWQSVFGKDRQSLVVVVCRAGFPVAGGLFEYRAGEIMFGAADRADYGDLLLDKNLSDEEQIQCVTLILQAAGEAFPSYTHFRLRKMPLESKTIELLVHEKAPFHCLKGEKIPAPRMDMAVVEDRINKKSLKRHANGLARLGDVEFHTYSNAGDILPRLHSFFEQHVARWAATGSPSLFNDSENREFYLALTEQLEAIDSIRYSELTVDRNLLAAHFGFKWESTFLWYKPSFNVALARHSPGEVLLRNLLQLAQKEGVHIFDFTIGGESFKYRFATDDPGVSDLYICSSRFRYLLKRAAKFARKHLTKS